MHYTTQSDKHMGINTPRLVPIEERLFLRRLMHCLDMILVVSDRNDGLRDDMIWT